MALCTLAHAHAVLGIPDADTEHDTLLAILIAGVSADLARLAGRVVNAAYVFEKSTVVEYFSPPPGAAVLWLTARPVVSITEIKEASYGGFDDATALVENTDYQIHKPTGKLIRIGQWLDGDLTVRVTYPGGYAAAGATPGVGETALPADVYLAAARQVAYTFNRRNKLGMTGAGVQGASYENYAKDDLLPDVRKTILRYGRKIG